MKGRPDQREGKKASSGYFFSPREKPSLFGRSPEDCERKVKTAMGSENANNSLLLYRNERKTPPKRVVFFYGGEGFERLNATVRWTVFLVPWKAATGSKSLYFFRLIEAGKPFRRICPGVSPVSFFTKVAKFSGVL